MLIYIIDLPLSYLNHQGNNSGVTGISQLGLDLEGHKTVHVDTGTKKVRAA